VLAVANVFTLVWYSIVLLDALMLPKGQRLVWPVVSWLGLAGCLALFASLPAWALVTGVECSRYVQASAGRRSAMPLSIELGVVRDLRRSGFRTLQAEEDLDA